MIVAFYSLLRKSNYAYSGGDLHHLLKRENLQIFNHSMELRVSWTKTLQNKSRVLRIPLVPIPGSVICPIKWLKLMLSLNSLPPESPLFIRKPGTPISYSSFSNFLKQRAYMVGLDPKVISSHSLRRGGATFAAKCGVSDSSIKLLGDWKSDCYQVYLANPFEQRLAAALKIKKGLMTLNDR
jgi:integrase